jgi:amyloid beta precursor protein binding protein 1
MELFESEPHYTLIIYSLPIDPKDLALVKKYGEENKVPVISIHSAGFYSYFQIHLPGDFPIVDTHPDSTATTDLRLLKPWPELSKFAEDLTKDIENLSAHEHGHIPYIALLLHYLEKWKESHGQYPSTYKDKKAFGSLVADGARTNNAEGGEENYDEAVAAVMKTILSPSLSSALKEVFDHKPNEVSSADGVIYTWLTYTRWSRAPASGSSPMPLSSFTESTTSFLYRVQFLT